MKNNHNIDNEPKNLTTKIYLQIQINYSMIYPKINDYIKIKF